MDKTPRSYRRKNGKLRASNFSSKEKELTRARDAMAAARAAACRGWPWRRSTCSTGPRAR